MRSATLCYNPRHILMNPVDNRPKKAYLMCFLEMNHPHDQLAEADSTHSSHALAAVVPEILQGHHLRLLMKEPHRCVDEVSTSAAEGSTHGMSFASRMTEN